MTLIELHNRIGDMLKANPRSKDNIVGVPDNNFKGMGGVPIDELEFIQNGIDWNSGKTMLYTKKCKKF